MTNLPYGDIIVKVIKMLLYIVRHGDPIYVTDTLTERGKKQAEAVGKRIYDSGINVIYSSPMGRARETAEPACKDVRP